MTVSLDGEIISETRNGIDSDYIPDPGGSTCKLVNMSMEVTDTFDYWPYGEVRSHVGSNPTAFTFGGTLGYYTDPWGGVYVRAREFQPSTTSWLQVAPLWPNESPYAYARSSPTAFADPTGLTCTPTEFEECWSRGYGGRVEEITQGQFLCFVWRGRIAQCVGTRRGREYKNCRSLHAGCYASRALAGPGWQTWQWNQYCDHCYAKCKKYGILGAIASSCDFWNHF